MIKNTFVKGIALKFFLRSLMYPWETTKSEWVSAIPTRYPIPTGRLGYESFTGCVGFVRMEEKMIRKSSRYEAKDIRTHSISLQGHTGTSHDPRDWSSVVELFLEISSANIGNRGTVEGGVNEWTPPQWYRLLQNTSMRNVVLHSIHSMSDAARSWYGGVTPSDKRIIRIAVDNIRFTTGESSWYDSSSRSSLFMIFVCEGERIASTRRVEVNSGIAHVSINQLVDLVFEDYTQIKDIYIHVIQESENETVRRSAVQSPTSRSVHRSMRWSSSMRANSEVRSELLGKVRLDFFEISSRVGRWRYSDLTLTDKDFSIDMVLHMHPQAWDKVPPTSMGNASYKHSMILSGLCGLTGEKVRIQDWLQVARESLYTSDLDRLIDIEQDAIIDMITNIPTIDNLDFSSQPLLNIHEIVEFKRASIVGRALLLLLVLTEKTPNRTVYLAELSNRNRRMFGECALRLLVVNGPNIVDSIDPATGRKVEEKVGKVSVLYTAQSKYVANSGLMCIEEFVEAIHEHIPCYSVESFNTGRHTPRLPVCLFEESRLEGDDHQLMEDVCTHLVDELTNIARDRFPGSNARGYADRSDWSCHTVTVSHASMDEFLQKFADKEFFVSEIFFNLSEFCIQVKMHAVHFIGYCKTEFILWYI